MRTLLLATMLVGCGPTVRRGPPVFPEPPPRVEWTSQMKYATNYVPAIEAAAVASGCVVREESPNGFKAMCSKVEVNCSQAGRIVTRGCAPLIDYDPCKRTWEGIIKAISAE